jgi:hypothetical protein
MAGVAESTDVRAITAAVIAAVSMAVASMAAATVVAAAAFTAADSDTVKPIGRTHRNARAPSAPA